MPRVYWQMNSPDGVFSKYYGYDVSEVAVKVARDQVSEPRAPYCVFEQCEMSLWKGSSGVSLILLEMVQRPDSINLVTELPNK